MLLFLASFLIRSFKMKATAIILYVLVTVTIVTDSRTVPAAAPVLDQDQLIGRGKYLIIQIIKKKIKKNI